MLKSIVVDPDVMSLWNRIHGQENEENGVKKTYFLIISFKFLQLKGKK
jgi:hypothetical protein